MTGYVWTGHASRSSPSYVRVLPAERHAASTPAASILAAVSSGLYELGSSSGTRARLGGKYVSITGPIRLDRGTVLHERESQE